MQNRKYKISIADQSEYKEIGELMAKVYAALPGFPSVTEQPKYYALFANLNSLADNQATELITARSDDSDLLGSVIYFSDMKYYGSGGTATSIKNASGLRLLAVKHKAQGNGIGRALTNKCIELAREKQQSLVILHTTEYMRAAWALYEKMGFKRFEDIDFLQEELPVFGFQLVI